MRLVFILLLFSISSFGQATFHSLLSDGQAMFVSSAGSGLGDGSSPTNSLSFTNFLLETIPSGTTIYFNRGDSFNFEDYNFTVPAHIKAYGSGADPIFDGSDDISGLTWTSIGGNQYTASVVSEPKWIWIDGLCAKNAETARVTVSARPSATQATVPNGTLDAYTSIVGAYIVIKEKVFQQSIRLTITGFNTTTDIVTFTGGGSPTTGNVDLVVYNDTEFLNGNDQWVWTAGTLTVQASASPSTKNIRKSDATYGIKTTAALSVDNIEFKNYYTAAIWSDDTDAALTITNCSFHDIRDVALLEEQATTNSTISNNTFTRIGNNGVLTRAATDMTVTGNTFTDIGMQDNYGWQTWSTGPISINLQNWYSTVIGSAFAYEVDFDNDAVDGSNLLFDQNTISNVAYCGLNVGVGTGNTATRNLVSDITNRFTDGGGIYFFHYRAYDVISENNEVANNIIHDNNDTKNTFGIYMDNRTARSNVHHNTVYDITYGNGLSVGSFSGAILLNYDTEEHTVENNNIFNCDFGIVPRQSDDDDFVYVDMIDNQVNNNVIATKLMGSGAEPREQFPMMFNALGWTGSHWNPYSGTGGADNNVYNNKQSGTYAAYDTQEGTEERSLAQIQSSYSEDASSVASLYVADLVVNATAATSNEDAQSNYKDLATGSTISTYTIDPYYSRIIGRINLSNRLTAASSQYYNAGTTADIQFSHTDIWSLSFWFKTPSSTNPGAAQCIIGNQNGSSRGWGVFLTTGGAIQLNLVNTVTTNRRIYATSADIADGNWHHVMIIVADASPEIYIDGGTNTSALVSNNLTATIASTSDLLIGALTGPGSFADIYIDDVAIYSSDQTASRLNIYNGGQINDLTRRPASPLHYWHMGNSAALNDNGSGTALNLTGVNTPTSSTDIKN